MGSWHFPRHSTNSERLLNLRVGRALLGRLEGGQGGVRVKTPGSHMPAEKTNRQYYYSVNPGEKQNNVNNPLTSAAQLYTIICI